MDHVLGDLDDAVTPELKGSIALKKFLEEVAADKPLSLDERRIITHQAKLILQNFYVHLPTKRALYSIDPIRRLHSLCNPLSQIESDLDFHRAMTTIFISLRDQHTNYLLPDPYNKAQAFLPFMIEEYFEGGERKYLVSHVNRGFKRARSFRRGVEVLSWNETPIGEVVETVAGQNAGGNEAARRARGLHRLTIRPMMRSLVPSGETSVTVHYRSHKGREHRQPVPWLVFRETPESGSNGHTAPRTEPRSIGLDLEGHAVYQMRKRLFARQITKRKRKRVGRVKSEIPEVFEARLIDGPNRKVGYIRIRTFNVDDAKSFTSEFVRLLKRLPRGDLIIDVRDNSGGSITAAEQLLGILSRSPIEPENFQLINTRLSLELCKRDARDDLRKWIPSLERAQKTREVYSAGLPISSPKRGRLKTRPRHIVLVTNALCYSATDIFAAGFKDHEIGLILGTDENTGAGGANVWTHEMLRQVFGEGRQSRGFRPLPRGAGLRVALRRALRVKSNSGTQLEDLGVIPDAVHKMTHHDLLNNNKDLIKRAVKILSSM